MYVKTMFCLVACLLTYPRAVFAIPSFTVTPPIISETLTGRDIVQRTFTVTNTGSQQVTIYPSVNNIAVDEGGSIETFLPPAETDRTQTLSSWIEIKRSGITLPVGESVTIPIAIKIHPNPVPGEYHAYIGFGWGRNTDIAQQLVQDGRAPGAVVTVVIEDTKSQFLHLAHFTVDRFITSPEKNAATYTLKNPSESPLTPSGEIIFYDTKGVEVATTQINPNNEVLAPGAERTFETTVPTDTMFGRHKAFLSVEYGSQLASVQDTTFFYVFPLNIIIGIAAAVALLVSIMALYIHHRYLTHPDDDTDHLPLHITDTISDTQEHDIDLTQQ